MKFGSRRIGRSVVLGLIATAAPHARAQTVPIGALDAGTVTARTGAVPGGAVRRRHDFESGQTIRVLGQAVLEDAGPVGGAAQALSYAPGVAIDGYSTSGAGKSIITINGVNQGWSGLNGNSQDGAIGVTFDHIPIADPVTGLWQAPTLPFLSLIGETSVAYGPGDPDRRWYDSLAGAIGFLPIQPSARSGSTLAVTYGSDDQKSVTFDLRTGRTDGWSSVLAGGVGSGNSYRQGGGFDNPDGTYAIFLKTTHKFAGGTVSFGAYDARSEAYRPTYIPQAANPDITIHGPNARGQPIAGPAYSQATSGYYATPPFATYDKNDSNAMALFYTRTRVRLAPHLELKDQAWLLHIKRTHSRITDNFTPGATQDRLLQPHTDTLGDKLWLTAGFAGNKISLGGYALRSLYNNKANFYDPADGGGPDVINPGGSARDATFTLGQQTIFVQDRITPLPYLTIVPGLAYSRFSLAYHQAIAAGFDMAPGAAGNFTEQDTQPASRQTRAGVAPSLSVNARPLPWLALYASDAEALKSPEVGGGGGLFQQIVGSAYRLELGQYLQAGVKLHAKNLPVLGRIRAGIGLYRLRYARQTIPITLNDGGEVAASGTSQYRGINLYADVKPLYDLSLFINASIQNATYQSYIVENAGQAVSYAHFPISYVPARTLNIGAAYRREIGDTVLAPRIWFHYVGPQHLYNGITTAPDYRSMPGYGTLNLALKLTLPLPATWHARRLALTLTALNVLDQHYNSYEYISSGGYFGTASSTAIPARYASGYINAYPGAPMTIYGSLSVSF